MKRKETAVVFSQKKITDQIMDLVLEVSFSAEAVPGQFVSLFSADRSRLLPRPISICGADPDAGRIRLVYRIAGEGTREFSHLGAGETIGVMGPLGNGFPIDAVRGKRVLLIGGGIGIPPLLMCADALGDHKAFAAGYRSNRQMYLYEELKARMPVLVSTDDGSAGVHGTVMDAVRSYYHDGKAEKPDVIFSCGPRPMLRAAAAYAAENGIECFVSMEERMACGIGVCLGCITGTRGIDSHSYVKNARVCRDGPVFRAEEVDLT